jgi:cellulose synthase operon protein C
MVKKPPTAAACRVEIEFISFILEWTFLIDGSRVLAGAAGQVTVRNRTMKSARAWRIAVCFSALAAISASASAAEPAAEFLKALRQAGFHDVALEYLEKAKTSNAFDADFKQGVQYELGVTLIDLAQNERTERARDQYFERAIAELNGFIKSNAGKPKANDARNRLTELNVIRALSRVERANAPGADRVRFIGEAKGFFDEAEKIITAQMKEADAAFAKFKGFNPEKDKAKEDEHNAALFDVVWSRLQQGQIEYMRAKMFKEGDKDHTAQLKKAAAGFNKIYTDYQKLYYYGSIKARQSEGRCYQDMGDVKQAATLFDECLGAPADPDIFRDLKTKTFVYACEAWVDPKVNKPDSASERGGEWLIQARPNEMRDPDWLALRYFVALSKEMIVKKATDPNATKEEQAKVNPAMRQQLTSDAISIVRPAASLPNPYRSKAQALLDRLAGSDSRTLDEPKSFAEAKQRGDDLFGSIRSKMFVIEKCEEDLGLPKNPPEEINRLKKEIADAQKAITEMQPQVIDLYRLALSLARPTDKLDDINTVRFNLCLIYYQQDKLFEAATIGEFLLRRYPQSPGGRNASKIALASWSKLNGQRIEKKEDNKFELARMAGVAQSILTTWTDKETANDTNVLIANIYIEQSELDKAEEHLNKVSDDFPKKAAAMMSLGQALSREYFTKKRLPEGERPAEAELTTLIDKAQKLIEASIKQMDDAGTVTPSLINAAYTLAQIYIDDGKHIKAVPLVEHAKYGPLALLNSKSPLLASFPSKNFPKAVYNLALRAYIGAIGENPDYLAKAEKVIGDLEKIVDSEELLYSYSRMAQELKKLLAEAPEAQRQSIASGYVKFLVKMRDGGNATSYNTLAYILKSFEGLAESFTDEGKPLSEQAKSYFAEAVKTGEKIVSLADEKKLDPAPDETKMLAVRAVLAKCASRTGDLETALDMYEAILGAKPYMLSVQVDAAMAYQQMGREDSKYFKYALGGGRPGTPRGEKQKIWGWTQISKVTLKNPKYIDTFHEARYQMAVCYFELGRATDAERSKDTYFGNAKKATMAIYKQFPTMGGPELKAKYERLIKQVQKELGESQQGLAEFGPPPPTTADQAAK